MAGRNRKMEEKRNREEGDRKDGEVEVKEGEGVGKKKKKYERKENTIGKKVEKGRRDGKISGSKAGARWRKKRWNIKKGKRK